MAKVVKEDSPQDNIRIDADVVRLSNIAYGVGVVGLLAAFGLGRGDLPGFFRAYLAAFMYTLSIGLGLLWFVCIQHLTNARWSVVVRRVAEIMTSCMPVLALLSLVILLPVLLGNEDISKVFIWLDQEKVNASHMLQHKAAYLNKTFFLIRCCVYFAIWAAMAHYFFKRSVAQDESGEQELSGAMQRVSAPGMLIFSLSLTFCAFDFLMSLDPEWFSTIFGVYYFAGCVLGAYSSLSLVLRWLQSKGRLTKSVTEEHYHDLGKMMFGFIVFWAYIAFSQFMLIWYGDMPEETHWFHERLAGEWRTVSEILLVGHFVIPFLGLLSRHIKRSKAGLMFWAVWLLVIHYVDIFWLVTPSGSPEVVPFGLVHVLSLIGILGISIGFVARKAKGQNLIPTKDPRLAASLAFENG